MSSRVDIIRDIDTFLSVQTEWDRLVADSFDNQPFFRHFWYANYYRAYFMRQPLFVLTVYQNDTLSAALPMVIDRRRMAGIPLKETHLIGGAHSHLNRILVSPDDDKSAALMLDRIIQEDIDLLYFEDLPDCFPNQKWLEEYCHRNNLILEIRAVRESPYIPVTGDFEDYRGNLSKKFRQLLNNRLNRINRDGGFEVRTIVNADDFENIESDVQAISRQSWQGEEGSGIFSGRENPVFYRNLIQHSLEEGYGRLSILYFDDQPAAFEYHVTHKGTEYCLKSEYSREFDRVSPGAVLDAELVKQAFESDITVYDLLGFSDSYKLRWTRLSTPYNRYFIFSRSAAARLAYVLNYRLGNRLRKLKNIISSN